MLRAKMRESEVVNSWPVPLRYFWTQLWGYCDDWGRGKYDPRLIKADAFPLDDEITAAQVGRWMRALEVSGVIVRYEVGGRPFFYCPGWDDSQSLRYRKKSDIPEPPRASAQNSATLRKTAHQGEGEVEEEEEGGRASANAEPTPFCKKHPKGTDAPCRACGDARRRWQAARDLPEVITLPPRTDEVPAHDHRWLQDGSCMLCTERREVTA
jgi:hypothetical protein